MLLISGVLVLIKFEITHAHSILPAWYSADNTGILSDDSVKY